MLLKDNQYVNMEEAAKLLGWNKHRLRYYVYKSTQKIPHSVQGGHPLFDPAEVLDWKSNLKDHRRREFRGNKTV